MEELNDTQRYFVDEHVEDYRDGLITRRELVRRVTLIAGSAAAAATILSACDLSPRGGAGGVPSPTPAGTSAGGGASPTAGLVAAGPYATPPAALSTDGITVKPDDPRITVSKPDVRGTDGAALQAYMAKPNASGRVPGILVVHENRGQTEHIRDVVRRVATAGFVGLNIDLAARDGGAEKLTDQAAYNAALGKRSTADKLSDHKAALDFLKAQSSGTIGVTGFCFGGGEVWNILAGGLEVKAAVPYYGPQPSNFTEISKTKAAVFAVYAELDTRITGTASQMEAELKKSGAPYQVTVYPGVNHAFHNDTGTAERYNAEQARKAWVATIEWFRKYLTT
ncbi:MAG TPA: dienelactone hydrolase family protein [Candidatus Limnocylindria bacterium]|nr:dienelactone hydrolase family protein [Candidatus Limnocylindria bacterium]